MMRLGATGLETARWGEAGTRTLVLLHEGLGCVALWRDFPAALAAATGCGVFAWSRAGYGGSDRVPLPRPLDYMHAEAALIPAVLDAAGIGDCILIGHSDGASIAAIHAGTACDRRVRGLVLMAPHYFVEDMCLDAIAAARVAYGEGGLRARLARYHADVDGAFRGWNEAWLDPGFRAFDITAAIARIAVPVLQIQGDADPYGTAAQPEAGARLIGDVRTLMLPARHAPHLEAPAATLGAIGDFVRAGVGHAL
ncbi:MAG: alpha/beta fold hydrolase [Rhodospirillales bacterium]|nr:alpha/beta fold hydrolase [Rhodospirillales bacterium]